MKKNLSFALSTLMVMAVLAGCAFHTNDWLEHADKQYSEERIEIEFWHSMGSSNGVLLQKLTDEFNQSQNSIYVKAVHQGSYADANPKFQAALSAGEAPVVAQMEIGNIGIFAEAGQLLDMKPYTKDDDFAIDDFTSGLLDASYYEGALIALPHSRSLPVMYYNKDLFQTYGLNPNDPPENWTELRYIARALSKDGNYGYSCPLDPWYYNALMMCAGGSIYNADVSSIGFYNKSGTAPLDLWCEMMAAGSMYLPSGEDYNSSEACRNLFAEGSAAMIMQSSAQLKGLEQTCTFDVGVAPIPIYTNRAYPAGGSNLVMFQGHNEEVQKAGWEFIKYMVSTDVSAAWANGTGYLPVRKSSMESEAFKNTLKNDKNLQIILDNVKYCSLFPFYPEYAETMEIISEEIQNCILEEQHDPEESVQNISSRVEELFLIYRNESLKSGD